jgi:periplasmic protein TonB
MYKKFEGLVLESVEGGRADDAKPGASKAPWLSQAKVDTHFADGMVENFRLKRRGTVLDFFISVLGHSFVVVLLILLPLLYTHAIDLPQFEKTLLVAPPPPPPPPPPAVAHVIQQPPKSFFTQGKLFAPKFIPKQIAQVKEEAPPPAPTMSGAVGGVPGGVPGGQLDGMLGGILGGSGQAPAPPPPPAPVAHKGPYRVGGKVQAPQLIRQVQPIYPPLARQARIHGEVVIESVIDEQGRVTQMKVVSGSPLLVQAAMQALEQWRYQPTLLNGQPIAVDMLVTVHFDLGGEPS